MPEEVLKMTIRKVRLAELETLRELAERTFRDAWEDKNTTENFEAYCREHFSFDNVSAEFAAPGSEFYFAEIDGEPVAYLKLNIGKRPESPGDYDGPALHLERIYVLQGTQSQGLGAELLRFAEMRARETGATWIWLGVWQQSPRTIAFYERNGFSIFGTEIFWLGDDPQHDWLMRKAVNLS